MSDKRLQKLVSEKLRREKTRETLDYHRLLFGPQRDFVEDTAHLVAACCSRRAGKTHGIGLKLLKTADQYPGSTVFYITNTRVQAKRVMWNQTLLPMLQELGIKAHLNQNELSCKLPNGSLILLGGANDAAEIETYRGTKTPLVVLDEAQSFRSFLQTLIEDVFDPQTIDYNGQIYVTGTPNASCYGYFHDICKGSVKGWSTHHWTILENPHIPHAQQWLSDKRKRQGIREDDPRYMREWRGLWVRDTAGLVYGIEDKNLLETIPDVADWGYVLGLDFGYKDATAFCILGYSIEQGKIVTLESFEKTHLIPSMVAEEVAELSTRYDFESIVGDTGGLGKGYAEEMIQRYAIPVKAAEKQQKAGAIELLNGDLRTGRLSLYAPGNAQLIEDSRLLQWNYDKLDKSKHGGRMPHLKLEIDDRTPDHLTDAWLYGYRECRAYVYEAGETGPLPGSREAQEAFEQALWDEQMEASRPKNPWDLSQESLATDESLF